MDIHARQSLFSVSVLKGCFFENRDNGIPKRLYPLPSPLPRGEGTNCRESQQWSDFSYPIPSSRGRGLGRGSKQSTPPEAPRSARRAVVAWALPTKTENSIPFAIIFANVTHRQSPRYGSVQNPRCFQTTFRIKRSSETCKPALLPFWIQVKLTTRHDGKS